MSIRREITEYDGVYSPKRRVPEAEESAETESTVNALAKEDLQKPVDQFLAEILLIKEQLDELSDLVNKPIKNDE